MLKSNQAVEEVIEDGRKVTKIQLKVTK